MAIEDCNVIKKWCIYVIDFIHFITSKADQNPSLREFRNNIESMKYNKINYSEIKNIKNELLEWIKGLTMQDQHLLNSLLIIEFGRNLKFEYDDKFNLIKNIKIRGEI